jgi:hypothetical protein
LLVKQCFAKREEEKTGKSRKLSVFSSFHLNKRTMPYKPLQSILYRLEGMLTAVVFGCFDGLFVNLAKIATGPKKSSPISQPVGWL